MSLAPLLAVVAALATGVIVGVVAGRSGRRCVPEADWARRERELDDVRARVAELERALELAEAVREQGRVEARHLRSGLERSRDERALLAARDERSRAEVADLTRQRDLLLREVVGLQRRVAELRVARARGADDEVPDGEIPDSGIRAGSHAAAVAPEPDPVVDLRDGAEHGAPVVVDLRDGRDTRPGFVDGGVDARPPAAEPARVPLTTVD
jgi:hypothetical protein